MHILDNNIVFINQMFSFPISSVCFKNKQANGLITMYSLNSNDAQLNLQDTPEEQSFKINNELDHDPDGYLLWVPLNYMEKFISFLPHYIYEAYYDKQLNFYNGGISETFIFYQLDKGLLIECIDPECFSNLFNNCFNTFINENNILIDNCPTIESFFYVEDCHLRSNIQRFSNYDNGKVMLNILNSNGFKYHIS